LAKQKKVSCRRATPGLQANYQLTKRSSTQTWIPDQARDDKAAFAINSIATPAQGIRARGKFHQ
jgi:hypothetical protein